MAGKKKGKKDKKGKQAKKAAKKAAKLAKKAAKLAKKAPKQAPKKAAKKATQKAVKKVAKKAARPARKAPKNAAVARKKAKKARQQPESLRLRSAGPSFTVSDLQKSVAFYRDVLGFTQKDKWEEDGALKGVELVAGSVTFWLGQDDWKKGRDRVKGEGFRIYCGTSQDVDALAARVRAAGFTLAEEPKQQSWGGRDFAVRDPDGFVISISSGL
jgi:catechol 2,3-dioxygenase-like lactoylglutathione lyase family enzyme